MRLLLCFILLLHPRFALAELPIFRVNDVVALVGGEDMVVASELGYFETLVHRALPGHKLKFRSLAWEGDTVFAQRRDLNYPTLEAQLEKIGATAVIAQFGQMESLEGKGNLPEFVAAYERLIERLRGGKRRLVILVAPSEWRGSNFGIALAERTESLAAYRAAIEDIVRAKTSLTVFVDPSRAIYLYGNSGARDGAHMDEGAHSMFAGALARHLANGPKELVTGKDELWKLVVAKNRLWHHYARPQNWAFLAGDRTNQPSSRDHKDLSKRWFPEELEQFVPLIEAKEKAIWETAAKLNR